MRRALLPVLIAVTAGAQEPAARRPTTTSIPLVMRVGAISGVRELRTGQLLLSDGVSAAVYLLEPASGRMTRVGATGGDSLQYAQPGGFYAGMGDSTLLLDRALAKYLVISPSGSIVGSRSIKRRGTSSSSDADWDFQRLDRRGLSYFSSPRISRVRHAVGDPTVDSMLVIRFDASRQLGDTVAILRMPESRIVTQTANFQQTQGVIGSPLDEWGVASDGRVAVVRGASYRVDWISPTGQMTRGPVYDAARIPFEQTEKDSISRAMQGERGGVSVSGGPGMAPMTKAVEYFTDFKPPFVGRSVVVSPTGQVFVERTAARGSAAATFDVFDGAGRRTDRIELPVGARIIGFGPGSAYATMKDKSGSPMLIRIKL